MFTFLPGLFLFKKKCESRGKCPKKFWQGDVNTDDAPIVSRSYTQPSHSQTSRRHPSGPVSVLPLALVVSTIINKKKLSLSAKHFFILSSLLDVKGTVIPYCWYLIGASPWADFYSVNCLVRWIVGRTGKVSSRWLSDSLQVKGPSHPFPRSIPSALCLSGTWLSVCPSLSRKTYE